MSKVRHKFGNKEPKKIDNQGCGKFKFQLSEQRVFDKPLCKYFEFGKSQSLTKLSYLANTSTHKNLNKSDIHLLNS
jgi:hypothetical protein